MNEKAKTIGIIALVAMGTFSMTSCSSNDEADHDDTEQHDHKEGDDHSHEDGHEH